jgi:hypothetical protein
MEAEEEWSWVRKKGRNGGRDATDARVIKSG